MFQNFKRDQSIQLRMSSNEKNVLELMASRSPQGDVSSFLRHLIQQEYKRVLAFDEEIQQFVQKNGLK